MSRRMVCFDLLTLAVCRVGYPGIMEVLEYIGMCGINVVLVWDWFFSILIDFWINLGSVPGYEI